MLRKFLTSLTWGAAQCDNVNTSPFSGSGFSDMLFCCVLVSFSMFLGRPGYTVDGRTPAFGWDYTCHIIYLDLFGRL